ncbi:MAG TPA: prepilin-type N-terminal cleavage/methylation domain-containing protein [Planctomycetes bacterium]|nr:prepilin-type N-terminal cleavage/methylation domain-containing protein [Planctomycetota bacterium]
MHAHQSSKPAVRLEHRGFTLIEVLLAIMITAMVVTAVLQIFDITLYAREEIKVLSEPMKTGPRILDMIEDDIRAILTYDIKDGQVFKGEDRTIVRAEADRMHMIVFGQTLFEATLPDDSLAPAPLAEVSWLCKPSDKNPDLVELWRREDPLVDEKWTEGGSYFLLSDRVRSFNITYYDDIGREAEELSEWDMEEKKVLPRHIKIELELERRPGTWNVLDDTEVSDLKERKLRFVRHIVIEPVVAQSVSKEFAFLPAIPSEAPKGENEQAGGGAGPAAGGGRRDQPGGPGRGDRGGVGKGGAGDKGRTLDPGKGAKGGKGLDDLLKRFQGAGGRGGSGFPGLGGGRGNRRR